MPPRSPRAGRTRSPILFGRGGWKERGCGIDRLPPGPLAALQRRGFSIADTERLTLDARAVKTPEELVLLRLNGRLACAMLDRFEAAIEPGVREIDLLAEITDELLRGGGEYLIDPGLRVGAEHQPLEPRGRCAPHGGW